MTKKLRLYHHQHNRTVIDDVEAAEWQDFLFIKASTQEQMDDIANRFQDELADHQKVIFISDDVELYGVEVDES